MRFLLRTRISILLSLTEKRLSGNPAILPEVRLSSLLAMLSQPHSPVKHVKLFCDKPRKPHSHWFVWHSCSLQLPAITWLDHTRLVISHPHFSLLKSVVFRNSCPWLSDTFPRDMVVRMPTAMATRRGWCNVWHRPCFRSLFCVHNDRCSNLERLEIRLSKNYRVWRGNVSLIIATIFVAHVSICFGSLFLIIVFQF